jgi:hypothetical protein
VDIDFDEESEAFSDQDESSARIMSKIPFLLLEFFFLQSITRAHMKPPTKAAPVEKEEEEIVEIPVTVGTPPLSVADPGSGAFLTPLELGSGSGIWDGKIRIPDHIFESLETSFELKYISSLMRILIRDPGSFSSWIRNGKIPIGEPGTNIPNPHHCHLLSYYCIVLFFVKYLIVYLLVGIFCFVLCMSSVVPN